MAKTIKLFSLRPGQKFRISDKFYYIIRYTYKTTCFGKRTTLIAFNSKHEETYFTWNRNVYLVKT